MKMDNIKIVDVEFDDLLNVPQVASELGIDERVVRALMKENVIKSTRFNGYVTKRHLLDKYKKQRAEL